MTLSDKFHFELQFYQKSLRVPESQQLLIYINPDIPVDKQSYLSMTTNPVTLRVLYEALKKHNDKNRTKIEKRQAQMVAAQNLEIAINQIEPPFEYKKLPPINRWKYFLVLPFNRIHLAVKWFVREVILNILAIPCAYLVSFVANRGNPHYRTDVSNLTKTVASLIFPAGLKKPVVCENQYRIDLGPVLGKQFQALLSYEEIDNTKIRDRFRNFLIKLDQNTILSGIQADNHNCKIFECDCYYIVYFNGNSGCYQFDDSAASAVRHLDKYMQEGNLKVSSVLFNYPGVLDSTGKIEQSQDLVQAGIAQIERLNKHLNIPYHKIALHGVSLGGGVAAHVASYYENRKTPLAGAYLSRTFGSTTSVGLSYLTRAFSKFPTLAKIIGIITKPIIAMGTWASRWELHTAGHYLNLPKERRAYSVIRSNLDQRRSQPAPLDDAVLGHDASLHEDWRLKLRRLIYKFTDKEFYHATKDLPKMSVCTIAEDGKSIIHRPDIDGHSEVSYNEGTSGLFLLHRHPRAISSIEIREHLEHEAGKRVREQIKKWFDDTQLPKKSS